jgi:hypothetical protein
MHYLILLAHAATTTWASACALAAILSLFRPDEQAWRFFAKCHQALWIFAPPGYLLSLIDNWNRHDVFGYLLTGFSFVFWWRSRNWPNDNEWKRRAKRAAEKVASLGHRLVVVPG